MNLPVKAQILFSNGISIDCEVSEISYDYGIEHIQGRMIRHSGSTIVSIKGKILTKKSKMKGKKK